MSGQEKSEPKRDCNGYFLCLTDEDWQPSHCKNCTQYQHKKTEAELIKELEDLVKKLEDQCASWIQLMLGWRELAKKKEKRLEAIRNKFIESYWCGDETCPMLKELKK